MVRRLADTVIQSCHVGKVRDEGSSEGRSSEEWPEEVVARR